MTFTTSAPSSRRLAQDERFCLTGVGALIGGRLCDKLGRKKIYQWDMLFYAFGLLFIIFASSSWMLLVGYVIAGLAVGADVPAS